MSVPETKDNPIKQKANIKIKNTNNYETDENRTIVVTKKEIDNVMNILTINNYK